MIYLDHCGTTPLAEEVKKHLKDLIDTPDLFGNPAASHHEAGRRALEIVSTARTKISRAFNATSPEDIVFCSSATEANNLVLQGFCLRHRDRGCRVICSSIEHKSVLETVQKLSLLAHVHVEILPVSQTGLIDLDRLEQLLRTSSSAKPTLVSVMHVNNEAPIRQPIEKIASLCREYHCFYHCDAVQGYVREKIDIQKMGADALVVGAHKIYGPKGIGILVFGQNEPRFKIDQLMFGGEQEKKLRPGTLAPMLISGAGVAVETHERTRGRLVDHLKSCDDAFIQTMKQLLGRRFQLTVPQSQEAPGIVNFWIQDTPAQGIFSTLPHICLNRGASCTGAGGEKFSHVPSALGLPIEVSANVIRASFGWGCTLNQVKEAAHAICGHV